MAINYDLVIAGHIHTKNNITTDNHIFLTPGATTLPHAYSNQYTPMPSVYIYDTEDKKIESFPIKTAPKYFDFTEKDGSLNDILKEIQKEKYHNNLINISYLDDVGNKIDINEYKKARDNCLNISIKLKEYEYKNNNEERVDYFLHYIKNNYYKYYDEFKNIIERS